MKLLSSEWLKTKHTLIRWFVFGGPALMAACVVLYLAARSAVALADFYQIYFVLCASIFVPLAAGILTGSFLQEEELCGNFNGFLSLGISRPKLYLDKFAVSFLSLTICCLLTTLIICTGSSFVLPQGFSFGLFLSASLLAALGALPLLAIHIWLSFSLGTGASVGVSILGLLIAVLMGTTNLGDRLWYFLPWTYPVKLSMVPLAMSFVPQAFGRGMIFSFVLCLTLSLLVCVIFLLLGLAWFAKWDGRKNAE